MDETYSWIMSKHFLVFDASQRMTSNVSITLCNYQKVPNASDLLHCITGNNSKLLLLEDTAAHSAANICLLLPKWEISSACHVMTVPSVLCNLLLPGAVWLDCECQWKFWPTGFYCRYRGGLHFISKCLSCWPGHWFPLRLSLLLWLPPLCIPPPHTHTHTHTLTFPFPCSLLIHIDYPS